MFRLKLAKGRDGCPGAVVDSGAIQLSRLSRVSILLPFSCSTRSISSTHHSYYVPEEGVRKTCLPSQSSLLSSCCGERRLS